MAGRFTPAALNATNVFMLRSILVSLFCLTLAPHALAQTSKPVEAIQHVYVISIDGLRPDVLLRAEAPNLRRLMSQGCFTLWANTTDVAITLPSHVSMMTGVSPEKHGVDWNGDVPADRFHYPNSPTIFDLAHARGLRTAMVAGKSKFKAISRPETFDRCTIDGGASNSDLARFAADMIHDLKPHVMLIHLPDVDSYGHNLGWGTPQQIEAVGLADQAVGTILDAIDSAGLAGSTAIIVSADHGGMGYTHGGLDPRSRHIPWIIRAPGVRANYDLTINPELVVYTTDTFATACWLLGIEVAHPIDGKPIKDILLDRDPTNSTTTPATNSAQ